MKTKIKGPASHLYIWLFCSRTHTGPGTSRTWGAAPGPAHRGRWSGTSAQSSSFQLFLGRHSAGSHSDVTTAPRWPELVQENNSSNFPIVSKVRSFQGNLQFSSLSVTPVVWQCDHDGNVEQSLTRRSSDRRLERAGQVSAPAPPLTSAWLRKLRRDRRWLRHPPAPPRLYSTVRLEIHRAG